MLLQKPKAKVRSLQQAAAKRLHTDKAYIYLSCQRKEFICRILLDKIEWKLQRL
jgi:hypothetical protein